MKKEKKIGFLINPIAGMGGRVGLKGTDGVLEEAIRRGAKPVSPSKASTMLSTFTNLNRSKARWYTCSNEMGENALKSAELDYEVVYECSKKTTANDTKSACRKFLDLGVELILFCGGDGTARDIYDIIDKEIPMLGIPSGVKMHSGVFGVNAESAAKILNDFLDDELEMAESEILDVDEEKYRKGEWSIKLYGYAKTLNEPTHIQRGKAMIEEISDDEVKEDIAFYMIEKMEDGKDILFILGSGSTVKRIGDELGIDTTLLGIDCVMNGQLIAKDVNEEGLLEILSHYEKVKLVVSPIGAQGFVFGRGNLQLSPKVIRKIGIDNIYIISTPAKLARTPVIRVDTGDSSLDREFKGHRMVIIGDRTMRMVPIH